MNPIQRACTTIVVIVSLVQVGFAEDATIAPPRPYGAVPTERQLKWHELEFYGFLHFTVNTFTDKEWGYGDESPELFLPTNFSAEQIVLTAKMAGMTGLILTCKHHDGFCLWPSRYTEHSVKRSPWQDGKGDVVREISAACRRHGLKFGVYLSPWDRNHADYGKPAYVEYYRKQLRELLTQYGPIFEVWWDGANGGTGYYGGARENRRIDRGTYYGWEETTALVRELQSDACIFSDAGPDVRWNGNERGIAGDPCWATYTPTAAEGAAKPGPGTTNYREGNQGHRNGKYWLPAESDVSIRPGWFYHADQDDKVRSPKNLVDLYYASIGRGSSLLLNLPPNRRGRIYASDVESLRKFRQILDATFDHNLAIGATLTASHVRGATDQFGTSRLIDGDRQTYWATGDDVTSPELIVTLPEPVTFHVVDLREYLPLGQRVSTWALDRWSGGAWLEFAKGQSIGNRRLWRGGPITTDRVRLRLTGPVCPAISELGIYAEPRDLPAASMPDYDIELSTISSGYDGKTCWVHPRPGTIPGERPIVVLTMQKLLLTGSDVFFALNEMRTDDLGQTWSGPIEHASLGRRQEEDGLVAVICDFTPMWHAKTGKLLGTGHVARYRGNHLAKDYARQTAYSVYDVTSRTWAPWKTVPMPEEARFYSSGAGCTQRVDPPNGDILLPIYTKAKGAKRTSALVMRCRFDGETLSYVEHGPEMTCDVARGMGEPSLTRFADRFYLTIRNDESGYVTRSTDGLHFEQPKKWTFDDGEPLGSYNTQQHWVTHSDGLFLVYTRRGVNNDHVFRHRAPLLIAQVDPQSLQVIRATERVLVPERGARLGNFAVTNVNAQETWVSVAEWMQRWGPDYVIPVDNRRGADNSVYVAKIKWHTRNRLVDHAPE